MIILMAVKVEKLKKMKKITLIFTFLLLLSFIKAQDSIPPIVKLDTAILAIGDQTHLRISLPVPNGKEAIFPDFRDTIGHSLEILKKTIDTLKQREGVRIITHDYLITSFDTGRIYIPPFEVGIVENGFNSTVTTDTAHMYVAVPKVDMQKGIFDIKPVADLPFQFKEILPYLRTTGVILAIILIIAAILFYFFVYRKRKKLKNEEEVKDTRPADVKALEALYILKEKTLWQQGRVKMYYSELTNIIRHYLDERYELQTMESTSSEIMRDVKRKNIEKEDRENLAVLFQHADIAKFAKGTPEAHENDKSWNDTKQFIERTRLEVEDTIAENEITEEIHPKTNS